MIRNILASVFLFLTICLAVSLAASPAFAQLNSSPGVVINTTTWNSILLQQSIATQSTNGINSTPSICGTTGCTLTIPASCGPLCTYSVDACSSGGPGGGGQASASTAGGGGGSGGTCVRNYPVVVAAGLTLTVNFGSITSGGTPGNAGTEGGTLTITGALSGDISLLPGHTGQPGAVGVGGVGGAGRGLGGGAAGAAGAAGGNSQSGSFGGDFFSGSGGGGGGNTVGTAGDGGSQNMFFSPGSAAGNGAGGSGGSGYFGRGQRGSVAGTNCTATPTWVGWGGGGCGGGANANGGPGSPPFVAIKGWM